METDPTSDNYRGGIGLPWLMSMHSVIDTLETDSSEEAVHALREDLIRIGTVLDDQSMIGVALGGTMPEVIGEYRTFIAFMEKQIIG